MTQEPTTRTGLPLGALKSFGNAPKEETAEKAGPSNVSAFHPSQVLSDTRKAAQSNEQDEYFDEYFDDEDEESALETIRENRPTYTHQNRYSEIEEILKRNLKDLRQKYPRGGLPAFQFVTSEVLLTAPEDFFSRFEVDVREVTRSVQSTLSEKGMADLVGEAQQHPFDQELQDRAFRAVYSVTNEYMERMPYKGTERSVVIYMAAMDIVGMSRLDPLWRDRAITEIICNGPNDVQVEIKGQLYKVGACKFRDAEHLEILLERIFSSIGKSLTRRTPALDGRLYDQSRIAATHRIICPQGPNVAIRRHPEKYWSPVDLIANDSASEEMLTDVGNWIFKGCSYIVIGGTSSGKTSLLNATSCFFDPEQRILTLEDNLELKINPHKLLAAPMECLPGNPNDPNDRGVTMRDLVKVSLRMRPDGIVIGEVRDGAMYDLCQALNTGHWGASTVHANSPYDGIYRMQSLVTQAELIGAEQSLPLIAAAFDFIIMQERFPEDGSRKITSICEIDPYPSLDESNRLTLGVRELWRYEPDEGLTNGKVTGTWIKTGDLSDIRSERRHLHLTRNLTWPELVELAKI